MTTETKERFFSDEQLEIIEASSYDSEENRQIWNAAEELGIDFNTVEEAYSGEFRSDADFAQDMAEQLGETPTETRWPHYCIDWEYAGREIMMDYCEENGHYFRQM